MTAKETKLVLAFLDRNPSEEVFKAVEGVHQIVTEFRTAHPDIPEGIAWKHVRKYIRQKFLKT